MGETKPEARPRPRAGVERRGVTASPQGTASADLQALVVRTVDELAQAGRAERVAAWARRADGRPAVLAAHLVGSELRDPDAACWAAVAGLSRPTDLGAPDAPPGAARVVERHGLHAAAPIAAAGGEPALVLLLGSDRDRPGHVRPRTLGRLAAAAARLEGPAAASAAAARLERLDAEVRRLDRLAALGELVAEIVHEIRNPLVSVKTFLQLLPERTHDPEFQQGFREVASEELRRIERLLELLLQHGRPAGGSRPQASADAAEAVESVRQLVEFRAADRGIRLLCQIADALPLVRLSADELRQVLLNLMLNAMEVTPQGGSVRIRAEETSAGVVIEVEDEGPGVPLELRARVFEPFFSTKGPRAGGLGLSISRRIVDEAGGRIEVGEGAAGGARFQVTLSRHRP